MRRREFVATALASTTSLAGCAAPGPEPGRRATSSPAPLSAYGCPPYAPGADRVVCSHTVDREAASVFLLPSEERSETPDVELTLYNDSETELTLNPYGWRVWRSDGAEASEWTGLERRASGNGRLVLDPGETHAWTLAEVVDYVDEAADPVEGTYAAGIGVPDPDGSDWVRCVALVRLG